MRHLVLAAEPFTVVRTAAALVLDKVQYFETLLFNSDDFSGWQISTEDSMQVVIGFSFSILVRLFMFFSLVYKFDLFLLKGHGV